MEIKDIYAGIEKELARIEPDYREAEKNFEFHMAEAEKAETKMNELKANVLALREALAALEKGDFEYKSVVKPEISKDGDVKVVPANPGAFFKPDVKAVKMNRVSKGEVWKFAPNGTVLEKFTSQKSAAISLRWDQSSVSRFMKLDHANQIRKKGYYLDFIG